MSKTFDPTLGFLRPLSHADILRDSVMPPAITYRFVPDETLDGTIESISAPYQHTKWDREHQRVVPQFFQNGVPVPAFSIVVKTDERRDADDQGHRRIFVASGRLKRAIWAALDAVAEDHLEIGGHLTIECFEHPECGRDYAATYEAPGAHNGALLAAA